MVYNIKQARWCSAALFNGAVHCYDCVFCQLIAFRMFFYCNINNEGRVWCAWPIKEQDRGAYISKAS